MLRALFEIPLNNFPGVRLESLCYLGGRARPRLPALGKGRPANALERLGKGPVHFLLGAIPSFSQPTIHFSDPCMGADDARVGGDARSHLVIFNVSYDRS